MLSGAQTAEVQRVLRLRTTDRYTLRDMTKSWTTEFFEYAEQRAPTEFGMDISGLMSMDIIREYGREQAQRERHKTEDSDRERLHQELMTSVRSKLDELKKPHWTMTPTFWVAVAAATISLAAWLFPRK